MTTRARFYRDVTVGEASETQPGFRVLLDARPVKTPLGVALVLPTRASAEAIAEEWRSQGDKIRLETMTLTKFANTAIDRVASAPGDARAQIVSTAKTDLLCYRADTPAELVLRQSRSWDPILDWIAKTHGARFRTVAGIVHADQPAETIAAMDAAIARFDACALVAVATATSLLSSAVLALALLENRLTVEEAFAASQLDALYQAERWGEDSEAKAARDALKKDLGEATRFLRLLEI